MKFFFVPLDQEADAAILSRHETQKVQQLCAPKLRRRYVCAHVALRSILSQHLSKAPQEIQFEYGKNGKPLHPDIFFNLSHSQDLALIAVSMETAVGVDLEYLRPVPHKLLIAKRLFIEAEYDYLRNLPEVRQDKAFFELWTAREASVKCQGLSLASPAGRDGLTKQYLPAPEGFVACLSTGNALQGDLNSLKPLNVSNWDMRTFI